MIQITTTHQVVEDPLLGLLLLALALNEADAVLDRHQSPWRPS